MRQGELIQSIYELELARKLRQSRHQVHRPDYTIMSKHGHSLRKVVRWLNGAASSATTKVILEYP